MTRFAVARPFLTLHSLVAQAPPSPQYCLSTGEIFPPGTEDLQVYIAQADMDDHLQDPAAGSPPHETEEELQERLVAAWKKLREGNKT